MNVDKPFHHGYFKKGADSCTLRCDEPHPGTYVKTDKTLSAFIVHLKLDGKIPARYVINKDDEKPERVPFHIVVLPGQRAPAGSTVTLVGCPHMQVTYETHDWPITWEKPQSKTVMRDFADPLRGNPPSRGSSSEHSLR